MKAALGWSGVLVVVLFSVSCAPAVPGAPGALVPRKTSGQKLIVVGGGVTPEMAFQRFTEWGNGDKGHYLMVTWSTTDPEGGYNSFKSRLARFGIPAGDIQTSPRLEEIEAPGMLTHFKQMLEAATAVFFSGGYQDKFMAVVSRHRELKTLFQRKYSEGRAVMMGTSAGTAIVSDPMIDGDLEHPERFWTEEGLGLVPGVLFDQHFFKRQRQSRLATLMHDKNIPIGVGVDEDSALSLEDNRKVTVYGDRIDRPNALILDRYVEQEGTPVLAMVASPERKELFPGDTWDLARHPLKKANTY